VKQFSDQRIDTAEALLVGFQIASTSQRVRLRALLRRLFDIRPGEHVRTWSMFFYLLFVLFAYYIVKPVSRAMFLTTFDIDKLPELYILIAIFGGILAYLYSKLAVRSSLRVAVFAAMALSIASLVVMWWLTQLRLPWMIYVLNIWVSLFSIVTVSQGWLVASNLFDTRQAKRLYPLLGMGMVLGAAFGGEFTNRTAELVGTRNLLLASALMVLLAYLSFRVAATKGGKTVGQARGAEEASFSFTEMVRDITRGRHLQVIIGMMVVMYLVDTLVEYQFQAMARTSYRGDRLTAFFGQFYGIYLNGVEFVFQLFLTAVVVSWFGVGGTLLIAPVAVALCSVAIMAAPGVASAGAVRLTEASTRYTLNKTGMELLYMPLPVALRNRIKAFIDICVDRLSRGLGGVLLLLVTTTSLHMGVRGIAVIVVGLGVLWTLLAHLARREYVATIRQRLRSRQLDLASMRVSVNDAATIRLLETTAQGDNPRQAAYALGLLAEVPHYHVGPLLRKLATRPAAEVREKIYSIAKDLGTTDVLDQALGEIRAAQSGSPASSGAATAAVIYALSVAPDRTTLAAELLNDAYTFLTRGALEALRSDPDLAKTLITNDWLDQMTRSPDAERRLLGVLAMGEIRKPEYIAVLVEALGDVKLRRQATTALAAFGPAVSDKLSGILLNQDSPRRLRLRVPRVLASIPHQASVDALLAALKCPDLSLRAAVLKALNRLRETAPELNFDNAFVTSQILEEARRYYELNAALAPFREYRDGDSCASRLLARTIEDRLTRTLERLFRLLGLRYPPKEIYGAYLAVSRRRPTDSAAALEFLDNILDRSLKRILLPLLDAPENLLERGKDLYGFEARTAEEAIRELIRGQAPPSDPWLTACAMAAAAELRLRSLAPYIAHAAEQAGEEVSEVARSAEAALAV
jgi:ATP:ADP antiporter, AAA family